MNETGSWPEQDAVDAWCNKHGITLTLVVRGDLMDTVTEYRIRVQRQRDDLRTQLAERDATIAELRALQDEQEQIVLAVGPITCRNGVSHERHGGCVYCVIAQQRAEIERLEDGMEMAWVVIANASGWDRMPRGEWIGAAEKWRDEWHRLLAGSRGVPDDKAEEPLAPPAGGHDLRDTSIEFLDPDKPADTAQPSPRFPTQEPFDVPAIMPSTGQPTLEERQAAYELGGVPEGVPSPDKADECESKDPDGYRYTVEECVEMIATGERPDPGESCDTCDGLGWVWGYGLTPAEDPPTDQKYDCPDCCNDDEEKDLHTARQKAIKAENNMFKPEMLAVPHTPDPCVKHKFGRRGWCNRCGMCECLSDSRDPPPGKGKHQSWCQRTKE